MKKIMCIILSCIMMIYLPVNADAALMAQEFTQEQAADDSQKYAQCFLEEKYDTVWKACSASIQQQLSRQTIADAWKQTVGVLGSYIESSVPIVKKVNDIYITESILKYEKGSVKLTFSYAADGEIQGLWLNYVQEGEEESTKYEAGENDDWKEIEIDVGEYKLTGILTIPKGIETYPVVVMVQGSGSSDMNETIGKAQNAPFKEIAQSLAEKGIASLRYNKRYFEKPELADDKVTIRDEYMDDVNWLINWASDNVSEDVFVIGHSLGAMSAPAIAAENPVVKGIIMMAGSPRGLEDIMYDQNEKILKDDDAKLKEIKDTVEEIKKLNDDLSEKESKQQYLGVPASYWLSLRELDAENNAVKLDIPMCILQGSADFQVSVKEDFDEWKRILKDKENVFFKLYPGLNHLFMPQVLEGEEIDITEYDEENHIPQEVMDDIADFIHEYS